MFYLDNERNNRTVLAKYRNIDKCEDFSKLQTIINGIKYEIPKISDIDLPEADERIIQADITRAVDTCNSNTIYAILKSIRLITGEYCQGLCYIASFLRCFVDEKQTISTILFIIDNYGLNIWTHSLEGLHIEIGVITKILEKESPHIIEFMCKYSVRLEYFIQKYLYCLFVNVFNSKDLLAFWIRLLQCDSPNIYCYQIIVGILKNLYLIGHSDIIQILSYLSETSLPTDNCIGLYDVELERRLAFDKILRISHIDESDDEEENFKD